MKPRLEVDPAGRDTPVALETTTWKIGASRRLTVVAKATVHLVERGIGPPLAADPLEPGSVELAPVLPHPQITLVGHAYAPSGERRGMQPARIALERGTTTIFEKSILVYGDRRSPTDFAQPFDAMPLVHERAPGSGWNPVGRVIGRGDPPPNLVPVSPAQPIACFAPVPGDFPARAGVYAPAALRHEGDVLSFGLFDFRWFQDAPFDQWLARIEGDETLVLEGLSPHVPRLATDLPRGLARATWWHGRKESGRVRLRLDRIDVDVDRGVASLVWRGHFALPAGAAPGDLAIRVTMGGTSLADLLDDPSSVAAPLPPPSARAGAAALAALARAPRRELDATARLAPLTDDDIARAQNPMPFRGGGLPLSERIGLAPPEDGPPSGPTLVRSDPVARLLDGSLAGDALRAVDLSGAALANADLSARDLRGARLARADLAGANLKGACLDGCDLAGASLRGADLDGASLVDANLSGADLSRAKLRGAKLSRARLEGAVVASATLDEADLEKADLDDLDATEASFQRAVLRGVTMWRAACDRASFREAILEDVDAEEARFEGADLTRTRGARGRFIGARLAKARLDHVDWPEALLDGASLAGAFLVQAVLTEASLVRCALDHADLREASLAAADLREARCDGTVFDRTDLSGADLAGAFLGPDALANARTVGVRHE